MRLKPKFKIEKLGIIVFSIFYAIAGVAEIFLLYLSDFRLFTLGLLGILSLMTAYGFVKAKKWVPWLVVVLLLLGTTFGATALYVSILSQTFSPSLDILLLNLALIVYLLMTIVAPVYVLARREIFSSHQKKVK
jgi:uncharacterized membrane protein (DUF2068 family)